MPNCKFQNQDLYYVDEGTGPIVVFVHGTPTNSDEYEQVIKHLKKDYRCICIDHLGFGRSSKPKDGDYSIEAHTDRLSFLLKHLKIAQFHLVVHDFGGAIGLPLTLNDKFGITSLTLVNTWFWPLIESEPQMKGQQFLVSSGLLPWLYRYLNFSPRVLYKMGWGKHSPFSNTNHGKYLDQFRSSKDRSGTLEFLKTLFDFKAPCWKKLDSLLKSNKSPTQIVWGCADKLISTNTLSRWKQILPLSKTIELQDVGHFVAEEAPELLVEALRGHFEKTHKT